MLNEFENYAWKITSTSPRSHWVGIGELWDVHCGNFRTLQWRHNEHDGVANHQPHDCLLNRLSRRSSKKISKLRVSGLCARNSLVTGEFPAQRASNAENVSIWWRHHEQLLKWHRNVYIKQYSILPWNLSKVTKPWKKCLCVQSPVCQWLGHEETLQWYWVKAKPYPAAQKRCDMPYPEMHL